MGGIVGLNSGKVMGCVNNASVYAKGQFAGGIAGAATGSIANCVNIGTVYSGKFAGGITTCSQSDLDVSDCFNGGVVEAPTAAGIVVMTGGSAAVSPVFSNNINVGTVKGSEKSDALIYKNTGLLLFMGASTIISIVWLLPVMLRQNPTLLVS